MSGHDRQGRVSRGARLHRDDGVDPRCQLVHRALRALGTGCVVGYHQFERAASTPPASLISSTASCAAWITFGATTLLAPVMPTGMPMRIGGRVMAALLPATGACADHGHGGDERTASSTAPPHHHETCRQRQGHAT